MVVAAVVVVVVVVIVVLMTVEAISVDLKGAGDSNGRVGEWLRWRLSRWWPWWES